MNFIDFIMILGVLLLAVMITRVSLSLNPKKEPKTKSHN